MENKKKVIDTHGYRLVDAEEYIIDEIMACKILDIYILEIIHGYNCGTAIRDMIRFEIRKTYSTYFRKEDIKIKIEPLEEGRTQIIIA